MTDTITTIVTRKTKSIQQGDKVRKIKTGRPIGVLSAVLQGDEVKFGFALCRRGDRFKKDRGREISIGRAAAGVTEVPHSLKGAFQSFHSRVSAYFKGKNVPPLELFQFINEKHGAKVEVEAPQTWTE